MSQEMRQVLEMLSGGKVTVQEAEQLLKAVERLVVGRKADPAPLLPDSGQQARSRRQEG